MAVWYPCADLPLFQLELQNRAMTPPPRFLLCVLGAFVAWHQTSGRLYAGAKQQTAPLFLPLTTSWNNSCIPLQKRSGLGLCVVSGLLLKPSTHEQGILIFKVGYPDLRRRTGAGDLEQQGHDERNRA